MGNKKRVMPELIGDAAKKLMSLAGHQKSAPCCGRCAYYETAVRGVEPHGDNSLPPRCVANRHAYFRTDPLRPYVIVSN